MKFLQAGPRERYHHLWGRLLNVCNGRAVGLGNRVELSKFQFEMHGSSDLKG